MSQEQQLSHDKRTQTSTADTTVCLFVYIVTKHYVTMGLPQNRKSPQNLFVRSAK